MRDKKKLAVIMAAIIAYIQLEVSPQAAPREGKK
jgi:hypothetical protein